MESGIFSAFLFVPNKYFDADDLHDPVLPPPAANHQLLFRPSSWFPLGFPSSSSTLDMSTNTKRAFSQHHPVSSRTFVTTPLARSLQVPIEIMGKGSNVQKAQQARERNQKKMGKSDEERKAASDKAKKDAAAKMCALCRQTFMVNARPPLLYQHIVAKHPELVDQKNFGPCFPGGELDGFDPNDPKGEKSASSAKSAESAAKTAAKKKATADLDALLDAGISSKKK